MSGNAKAPRRWMPVALIASLAVNFVVAGVFLGAVLRFHGERGDTPPGFGPALYRALPDGDRTALRKGLAGEHRRGGRKRAEDFRQLGQALRAAPFNPDTVRQLLDAQAQANDEIQDAMAKQWLARVEAMTDAERRAYADRLDEVIQRRGDRHGKK